MNAKIKNRKSISKRLIACGIMALITVLMFLFSVIFPGTFFRVYTPFSRFISGFTGFLFSFAPFSFAEFLLYALILYIIIALIVSAVRTITKTNGNDSLKRYFANLLTIAVSLALSYFLFWGFQYRAPSVEQTLGFDVNLPYSQEDLIFTAREVLQELVYNAPLVPRDEDGVMNVGFSTLSKMTVKAYENLQRDEPAFRGGIVTRPKRITAYIFTSYLHIAGIYSPFTGEANVTPDLVDAHLPFSMAHEMAHRLGYASEDEANFVAYVSCMVSDDPEVRYSAALNAFLYCVNDIKDSGVYNELWSMVPNAVRRDLDAHNKTFEKLNKSIEAVSSAISETINDSYLKANGESDGILSYNRIVNLLIAWKKR